MTPKIAVVIPLYNHQKTICEAVRRTRLQINDVFVFNDGSTDIDHQDLLKLPAKIFSHKSNQGKGATIIDAAIALDKLGYTHMITIDADLQHYPEDLPRMLAAIWDNPKTFIIGSRDFNVPNVPKSSRFGRSFSAFWCFVQTGQKISDPQSGFRSYPLKAFLGLKLHEKSYALEIEVLIKALWAGFEVCEIPIRVFYPQKEERISHFKTVADNLKISLLNTKLTIRAMTPIPFACQAKKVANLSLRCPLQSLKIIP